MSAVFRQQAEEVIAAHTLLLSRHVREYLKELLDCRIRDPEPTCQ